MILSIVLGTYQRLRYLQRMVFSARARIPRGISYEFVIVDGGSTDGTLDWLRQQADVRLIEHGALFGAIRAFTEGAEAAQGEYVLLANDDVEFTGNGIVKALVHLETHPTCGAVAFADDRPAPGYGEGYKVQTIRAVLDGNPINVPYAQVGLFRRALGDTVGWWGWHDPIMSQSRTYGGDSWLSARIWELGYTVDAVDGVAVNDLIAPDALRAMNTADAVSKPSAYYQYYPNGVPLPEGLADAAHEERLRVLYLPIYEIPNSIQHQNKRGLREALAAQFLVCEADYVNDATFNLFETVRDWQPHLLLMQLHSTIQITAADIHRVRLLYPEMVVVNWNGDVFREHLVDAEMIELLREVDVQLTVNASVLPTYAEQGILAAYWQIGYEPVPEHLPTVHHHDIVFLANAYTPERVALGTWLKGQPYDVGLYGYGWGDLTDGFTLYDFTTGAALYRTAQVAIGDNQYPDETGFVSNRVFEALANGAFLLHQTVSGLESLTGLRDGTHYVSWKDTADLKKKLKFWLAPAQTQERAAIAAAGEAYVRQHHSFAARVDELFTDILTKVGDHEPA